MFLRKKTTCYAFLSEVPKLKLRFALKDTDPNKNYALYGNLHVLHVYVLFL